MIKVIKKDGRHQAFDPAKIRTSVLNASQDVGHIMSKKEAQLISDDVERQVVALHGAEAITSSYELRSLVRAALREFGYTKVAESFETGKGDMSEVQRHLQAIQEHARALEIIAGETVKEENEDDSKRDKTHVYSKQNED